MSIVNYIYLIILSVCFLTGLYFLKLFTNPTKVFFFYITITILVELSGYYLLYFNDQKKANSILYSFYFPVEFTLISVYFYNLLNSVLLKKLIVILIVVIILASFSHVDFKSYLSTSFLMSIYSIIYMRQLLNIFDEDILEMTHFWIVSGVLFFNACFFFLTGTINYISSQNLELAKKLYTITPLLNIIYYSLVTYGFICQRRLARSSS